MARNGDEEFAIIGLGRFGATVGLELVALGHNVLGIDINPTLVQQFADELTHTVALDATDEEALTAIEISHFHTVVVAIGTHFESSVLVTVALKQMGVKHVISKALTERQAEVLHRVGADRVILPEIEAGQRLAKSLATPRLLDDMVMGPGYSVAEVHAPASLYGKTLAQSNLHDGLGLMVLAVRSDDQMIVAPSFQYTFRPNDLLVVLGPDASIGKLSRDQ